jgi:L-cysteine S-thiosulfotransferase
MKAGILVAATATLIAGGAFAADIDPSQIVWTDMAIEASLTGVPGNPEEGIKVFTSRSIANCVACHEVGALPNVQFPGDVGPMLDGAGDRWTEAELRGLIVDAKQMFDGTVMPSFYKTTGFTRPGDAYTGNAANGPLDPLLTAQQVEDVVAFLMTLKD